MAELDRDIAPLTPEQEAALYHSRERRRSLAGIPELFRTHKFVGSTSIGVKPIDTDVVFPDREQLVTFKTAVRFTNRVTAVGVVFEFGSNTRGCALVVGAPNMVLIGAGGAGTNQAAAIYGGGFATGAVWELVAAVRPGDGRVRLWANGVEIARATASAGTMGTGGWADGTDGAFAASAAGPLPALVNSANFAPFGFEVIEPLSVYMGQVPRHFV